MSTILIIGASHGIGLETVKLLLADGHRVRAFARSADRIAITDPNLQKIAGDALNTSTATDPEAEPDDPWAIVSQLIFTF